MYIENNSNNLLIKCMKHFFYTARKILLKTTLRNKITIKGKLVNERGLTFNIRGHAEFGNLVVLKQGSYLAATEQGELIFGNNVFINRNATIVARESIKIGSGCTIGPNVMIYDHDHAIVSGKIQHTGFNCEPVEIGDNCWIGMGTIILKGTKIGNNCIIGAGSLIKGSIPDNMVVYNKRENVINRIGIE